MRDCDLRHFPNDSECPLDSRESGIRNAYVVFAIVAAKAKSADHNALDSIDCLLAGGQRRVFLKADRDDAPNPGKTHARRR